jgi:hypothetical protein
MVSRHLLGWLALSRGPLSLGCASTRGPAAPPPAEPAALLPAAPLPPEGRLKDARDLDGLCRALAAADPHAEAPAARAVQVADIPATGFQLAGYEEDTGRLRLDPATLAIEEGATLYAVEDTRALTLEGVTAEAARRLADEHAEGGVALRLYFRPVGSPVRQEPCLRLGGGIVKLAVLPVAVHLLDRTGAPFLRTETEEYAVATGVPVRAPRVEVRRPSAVERRDVPEPLVRGTAALATGVMPCYQQALERRPALRGLLVLAVRLSGDGRVEAAHPELSTIDDEPLVACVAARLAAERLPAPGHALRLSLPIAFGAGEESP